MSLVRLELNEYRLSAEDRIKAAELWPNLLQEKGYQTYEPKFVDITELPSWVGDIDAIRIKPLQKVEFVSPVKNFKDLKPDQIKEVLQTVNQIVMPGFELLRYASIKVLTDECTIQIQKEMDQGWRIIGILPQPQQRRPDYIMVHEGRF